MIDQMMNISTEMKISESTYARHSGFVWGLVLLDMLLILLFFLCIVMIGRFLSKNDFHIDYRVLLAKASVAVLSCTARIVFVLSQAAFEVNEIG